MPWLTRETLLLLASAMVVLLLALSDVSALWSGVTGGVLALYCLRQWTRSPVRSARASKRLPAPTNPQRSAPSATMSSDSFYRTRLDDRGQASSGFKVPAPVAAPVGTSVAASPTPARPLGPLPARWVPPHETVEVCGYSLPGGLFYVGSVLKDAYKDTDPSLIDPRKPVLARPPAWTSRLSDYWPSYSRLSPESRAGYLQWLATGRRHPDADPAYVTMFFYGLERHVLLDGVKVSGSREHWPAIEAELRRLHELYAKSSSSLANNLLELLQYMQMLQAGPALYAQPLPPLLPLSSSELPFYVRLAVGQACRDKKTIPASLAFAWQAHHPNVMHRTAVRRCPQEFAQLFPQQYEELYGEGFKVAPAANPLVLHYRPVSTAFDREESFDLPLLVPDVAQRMEYARKLQFAVDQCNELLKAYSRMRVKEQGRALTLETLLRLPAALWPDAAQEVLEGVQDRCRAGIIVQRVGELLEQLRSALPSAEPADSTPSSNSAAQAAALAKDSWTGLRRALAAYQVDVAPAQRERLPEANDELVLLEVPADEKAPAVDTLVPELLLLELFAQVHGGQAREAMERCFDVIDAQVLQWSHLSVAVQRQLQAQGRASLLAPATAAALRKRLSSVEDVVRNALASQLCRWLTAQGQPGPATIRALEKAYKTLGLETGRVYADLHAAATAPTALTPLSGMVAGTAGMNTGRPAETAGTLPQAQGQVQLDLSRVQALQQDSARVGELLADIFSEEEGDPDTASSTATQEPPEPDALAASDSPAEVPPVADAGHPGAARWPWLATLPSAYAPLVAALLNEHRVTRLAWEQLCAAQSLMPDGALEALNEASFDHEGVAFTEGDDPIELNNDFLEMLP